jgi:hypothetical protein
MKELRRKFGLAVGSVMLLVFTGLITAAVFGAFGATLTAVGQAWFGLFSFIVLMAAITVFGREAYDAVRSMRSGGDDESGE